MALVKRIDFGIALGVKDGTIRSKISRKQLCCNKKGLIDTENRLNYAYLLEINGGNQDVFIPFDLNSKSNIQRKLIVATKPSEKKSISNEKKSKPSAKSTPKEEPITTKKINQTLTKDNEVPEIKESAEDRRLRREEEKARKELLDYDLRLKKANAIAKEREVELKTMEIEKKMGNTIPLDKAMSLMSINYKAIFKSFHSNLKNIASVTVHRLGGTNEDLHSVMIELEGVLDHIIEKSKEKSNHDIDILVQEYSDLRSRGEKK
jgi:hypothetical protein